MSPSFFLIQLLWASFPLIGQFSSSARWYCVSSLFLPSPQGLCCEDLSGGDIWPEHLLLWEQSVLVQHTKTPVGHSVCDVNCPCVWPVHDVCVAHYLEHWLQHSKAREVTANLPSLSDVVPVPKLLRVWIKHASGWQEGMKSSSSRRGRRWNFISVNSSLWRADWGSNSHLHYVSQCRLIMGDRNRTVVISLPLIYHLILD